MKEMLARFSVDLQTNTISICLSFEAPRKSFWLKNVLVEHFEGGEGWGKSLESGSLGTLPIMYREY